MKNTVKYAALGACALAASSTAAFAASELVPGVTTGLAIGAPLPEGVYDITIATYGSRGGNAEAQNGTTNPFAAGELAAAVPVWLIWSTPWQIAGGRIILDTATPVGDSWSPGQGSPVSSGGGLTSWLNTLVEAEIKWSLGNGWNFGFNAGAWLPSDQGLAQVLGRNYTAFQGVAAVSYVAHGWNLSATGIYGTGGKMEFNSVPASLAGGTIGTQQGDWFNLDLTATKKYGKFETGLIAYGSWDLSPSTAGLLTGAPACFASANGTCKQSQFAVGGLIGYDFGSFIAQAKLSEDVTEQNYNGREVRGWLTIIKPLWNPEAESLK